MQQHQYPPQSSWNQQAPPQQTGWAQSQQQQQQQPPQHPPPQQSQWNAGQPSQYPPQQQQHQQVPPQQQQWGNNQQYGQQQQQYPPGQYPPGQWQQPGMCSCCDQCCQQPGQCCQQSGQCCQCQPPYGGQVDPYCCGAPVAEQPDTTFCCDFTCWFVCLFFILTLIGLAVVLGVSDRDNIFSTFSVSSTRELATAINPYIPYQVLLAQQCASSTAAPATTAAPITTPAPNATNATTAPSPTTTTAAPIATMTCTKKDLFGSFGTYCLEDGLNAGTFAANLSHWNNFRGTLYFLAFIITLIFMVVVYAVHRQRNPSLGGLNASASGMPAGGAFGPTAPIALFGTDLYEVFRCVWFVSGTIVFFWVANAMTSFWGFSNFYKENTTGKLQDFWVAYDKKFVASVVCVTLYLAWPLFLIGAELGIWIVFILPYVGIRCMLKPGIENIRPELPDAEMPGWVRADMFFMEIQQIRRLGFTHRLWEMVTGSKEAFCASVDCCQMNNFGPQGGPPSWQQQLPPPQQPPARPGSTTAQAPRPGQMDSSIEMRRQVPPQQQPVAQQPAAQMQMSASNFFPQREDSIQASDSMVIRSGATEGTEVKEKKEKKHKHDKKEKSKEKKEKTSTKEKKEKKHKHDKKDKHDSD